MRPVRLPPLSLHGRRGGAQPLLVLALGLALAAGCAPAAPSARPALPPTAIMTVSETDSTAVASPFASPGAIEREEQSDLAEALQLTPEPTGRPAGDVARQQAPASAAVLAS